MRFLFTCLLGIGHFYPLVPFARALQEKGHEVKFAAWKSIAPQVEANGFSCWPIEPHMEEIPRLIPELQGKPLLSDRDLVRSRLFPEIAPKWMLPRLVELARVWPPDLVFSDTCEFSGRILAEYQGVPDVLLKVVEWNYYPQRQALTPQLDLLRASVGLPPDPQGDKLFRYLFIVAEPPFFRPDVESFPPTTFFMQRSLFDQSGEERLPGWVTSLPAKPVVFITLGTAFNRTPGLFETILASLRDEPLTLILGLGRDRDPLDFGTQPPNVHLERYIPQSLLFPYCDLVISHGGSGTLFAALDHGLPMINIPLGADQPENAAHLAAAGAGLVVNPGEKLGEELRGAVRQMLADPSFGQKARRLQHEMQQLPGLPEVVTLLERLAREKKPLEFY